MKKLIIYSSVLLLILSCKQKQTTYIFEGKSKLDLQNTKIEEVFILENTLHSTERKIDTSLEVGTALFSESEIKVLTHSVFERKDSKLFLDSDYYYSKKDSLLKVVIYTWTIDGNIHGYVEKSKNEVEANNKILKNKYEELKKSISTELEKDNSLRKSSPLENMTVWENDKRQIFISIFGIGRDNGIRLFIGPNYKKGKNIAVEVQPNSTP